MKVEFRYVKSKGVVYFHAEDVVKYIEELAATEETDTRNRLNLAARTILIKSKL